MKNFEIQTKGVVSEEFLKINISDFHCECKYIAGLPYKRNSDKNDIKIIFKDFGGTCSTKHATLRKLALENDQPNIKLILGIFKMDAEYTVKIKNTLSKFALHYIPEAHNYLKIEDKYYDFTRSNCDYVQFKNKLLIEKEIEYDEITSDKILFHKNFLEKWIFDENIPFTPEEIWNIREQCIEDLQKDDPEEIRNFSPVCFQESAEMHDEFKQ